MTEQLKLIEFDIASLSSEKHPKGAIVVFQDDSGHEISITTEPTTKYVTLSYNEKTKGKGQEHHVLRLSLKEIAERMKFLPVIKEKVSLRKGKVLDSDSSSE